MSFKLLNSYGKQRIPFLFICDYKAQRVEVIKLAALKAADIEFSIDKNAKKEMHREVFTSEAVPFAEYQKKFDAVIEKIKAGETYILNLTQPTKIQTALSLHEIYTLANAHYKLRFKNEFVCFSPETFIQIRENKIHTYPMKGTIDASVTDATQKILENKKELAEHIMVVDLLRNDLSIVAKDVKVERFRYVEKISAGEKNLLQVSSHISGRVKESWHEQIGDILQALLPAGSITGAPKRSTVEIIERIENYNRGFFTGVFGLYDGKTLDSAVMIRFIQRDEEAYIYKSGGGITLDSDVSLEYEEYKEKVYLP